MMGHPMSSRSVKNLCFLVESDHTPAQENFTGAELLMQLLYEKKTFR